MTLPKFGLLDSTAMIFNPDLSVFLKPHNIYIQEGARIDSFVKLQGGDGLFIGTNVHIASFCTINTGGGKVIFGNHSGCSNGVVIASGMPSLRYRHISAAEVGEDLHTVRYTTLIGQYVVIFANATILPGIQIGDYAVIGAGAVVTRNVEKGHVVVGSPARTIRIRKIGNLL